jgi:uncharacterized glyoxalase superfamily protein PhnB
MPVSPIPAGFHTLTPHITVKGCAAAIEFYKKAFGAKENARHLMPDGTIMHADLTIGDTHLMLNDEFPQMGAFGPLEGKPTGVTIHMYVTNVDQVFNQAVQAGAKPVMPVADMFWGDRYGIVVDPFGHSWSIATHTRDMSPEQVQKAMGGCA